MRQAYVDLSHTIEEGMITYRGLPAPLICDFLSREEILIVEHLTNLDKLIDQAFLFSAVPPKIKGMGSFPVRAYAKLKNGL